MGLLVSMAPKLATPECVLPRGVIAGYEVGKIIAKDSFNRRDIASGFGTADSGHVWKYVNNTPYRWELKNGTAKINSTSQEIPYIEIPSCYTNICIEILLFNYVSTIWPIMFRMIDGKNTFSVRTLSGTYRLYRNIDSASGIQIGTSSVSAASGDRIKVIVKDDLITVYINNIPCIKVFDTSLNTYTNVGFGMSSANGAQLDDLTVRAA